MENIDGPSLEELQIIHFRDHKGPLPEAEALRIMAMVCGAVQALHDDHILHRDIKPTNIRIGPDNEPILLNLGIAERGYDPEAITLSAGPSVFNGYAPPEQVEVGGTTTTQSDVYALGATAFYLLTGRQPWEPLKRLAQLSEGHADLPMPSHFVASISTETDSMIMQAMALRAEDRFVSAEALRQRMLAIVKHLTAN